MGKALVIVESPAKAKTIGKFLGPDYVIKASMGHVIDLPKSSLGIDVAHDFRPDYGVIRGKGKILKELASAAKKVDVVYLAMDPDREGEAIAWHLENYLSESFSGDIRRVTFQEITKKAIVDAVSHPSFVDMNLVNAQQSRRLLDRIVGYQLSPFLWRSVGRGLSAGRVQSIAVRLICEREEEINAFVSEESWSISARLSLVDDPQVFTATLDKVRGEKADLKTKADADVVLKTLEGQSFVVRDIQRREKKRRPDAPFITSTLQQKAAYKIRFSASKTMTVAQQLYEGIDLGQNETEGLITYMRTDSYRISAEASGEAAKFVEQTYGAQYVPDKRPMYGSKNKNAQDAHEAIRPTSVFRTPDSVKDYLTKDQYKLYSLIWKRFVQSQMEQALFDATTVRIDAGETEFKATGSVVRFDGFMVVDREELSSAEREDLDANKGAETWDERILPALSENDALKTHQIKADQHFTKPPARYSEATLVKALEEYGIGRPSTYAPTLKTIQDRVYVEKIDRRFHPTKLGKRVNEVLIACFPDLFNVGFTADMEQDLDAVAEGNKEWVSLLRRFYDPLQKDLEAAQAKIQEMREQVIETDEICEKCQSPMIIKTGRYGQFMACSNYPECRNTRDVEGGEEDQELQKEAPLCSACQLPMVLKMGRYGKFWACSDYPKCKTTEAIVVKVGVACPVEGCTGELVERRSRKRGKIFWGCSNYPECSYISNKKPHKGGGDADEGVDLD